MLLPTPNESDPEDVTTALETAAIFAAKGDVPEASRWLGRAADFANLAGNAARAETLALSARALSATRTDSDSEPSDETEAEIVARPLPEPPAKRVSVRPQAPSERPQDRDASNSQPMLLVRQPAATPAAPAARSVSPAPNSAAPAARSVSPAATPAARSVSPAPPSVRASTLAPLSAQPSPPSASSPQPSARPQGATAVASSPSRTPAPSPVNALAAKEQQEVSAVRESSPRSSPPPKAVETLKPTSKSSLHHELHRPFRLQGARVSISQSQASSRYYVLKVLEDGEPVPPGEHEAFVVLTDPNAAR